MIRGNAAEPHVVEITRDEASAAMVTGTHRQAGHRARARRRRSTIGPPADLKQQVTALTKEGAKHVILDLRAHGRRRSGTGLASARLFVE